MPDDSSILLTIAEVAAAFAGFAALVTVLGRRDHTENRLQFVHLTNVVAISIFTILAALAPTVILRFGVAEEIAWRVACGLFLVLDWVYIAIMFRAGRSLGLSAGGDTLLGRPGRWTLLALEITLQGLLLLAAFGLFGAHTAAVYLAVLVLSLFQVGLQFVYLLWSLYRVPEEEGA